MRFRSLLALIPCTVTVLLLAGCGTEVGRVTCDGPGTLEGTLSITEGKPVALWSDFDATWEGTKTIRYDVALYQDGKEVYEASCDPREVNTKVSAVETHKGSSHAVRHKGKLKCEAIAEPGEYEVVAEFVADEGVSVNGCDLFFKQ